MSEFKIEKLSGSQDGLTILRLTGPFTLTAIFDFQAIIRDERAHATIIDLEGVPYMDSAALGSLLAVHASCHRDGRKYALVGVAPRIATLFRVSGVDGLLTIGASFSEAEQLLTNEAGS